LLPAIETERNDEANWKPVAIDQEADAMVVAVNAERELMKAVEAGIPT